MRKQPDPADRYIGETVRKMRQAKGWSQAELGDYINVTHQQIQKYESAKNRLPVVHLLRIARAFDYPVQVFLPYDPDDPWGEYL